jgi:hypothetical protein
MKCEWMTSNIYTYKRAGETGLSKYLTKKRGGGKHFSWAPAVGLELNGGIDKENIYIFTFEMNENGGLPVGISPFKKKKNKIFFVCLKDGGVCGRVWQYIQSTHSSCDSFK